MVTSSAENSQHKPIALIYFTNFGTSFGGAEYRPLLLIQALQKRYHVILAVNWTNNDPSSASKAYNINIDRENLTYVRLKPQSNLACKIDAVIPFFRVRKLKKIAREAEICISCANMIDFGKPAHHFIYLLNQFGDNAFIDYFQHAAPLTGFALLKRRFRTWLAEAFLRPLLGVRSARTLLADPRETFYVNSTYVSRVMHEFYGDFNNEIFYPPTIFECSHKDIPRDPLKVVYIGRLTRLKKIHDIISIVEHAREVSGKDLKLSLGGAFLEKDYEESVKSRVAKLPWVELAGEVYHEKKEDFLLSASYAVHTCREEAFGICIAEYLKAGIIPIVPLEGGTCEIVNEPSLTFNQDEEAVPILVRLLNDDDFRTRMTLHCQNRAEFFTAKAYMDRQTALLKKIAPELSE